MIREISEAGAWNELVTSGGGHPLQLWAWGELKQRHGPWTPHRLVVERDGAIIGGAEVLARRLPRPFGRMFYLPRGPFGPEKARGRVLSELTNWAQHQGGVELKIEPDWTEFKGWPKGWRRSKTRVLLATTAQIDLGQDETEILNVMSKKTRQYIRKSGTDGVMVRRVTDQKDLAACLKIYHGTAETRQFGLHTDDYYYDLAKLAGAHNQIYLAEKDGQPLSFLWNLRTPSSEFELYGGANADGERWRSNFCLKWQAISAARAAGVKTYDLNGLLNDGVSNFKRGFTGKETTLVGAYDLPLSSFYWAYEKALPLAKQMARRLNRIKGDGHAD